MAAEPQRPVLAPLLQRQAAAKEIQLKVRSTAWISESSFAMNFESLQTMLVR